MRTIVVSVVALLAASGTAKGQTAAATSELRGQVMDGPKAVARAVVTYSREFPKDTDPTAAMSIAEADDQGNFAFTGLMAGTYILCASASPALKLVPTCEYTATPLKKTLQAGEKAAGITIAMEKGARIEFRVDDPFKLLPLNRAAASGKEVRVGFRSAEGMMHHAIWDSRDGLGREYSIIVPHGKPLNIVMLGVQLNVEDELGISAEKSQNAKTPVVTGPNDAPRRYNYKVKHDGKN